LFNQFRYNGVHFDAFKNALNLEGFVKFFGYSKREHLHAARIFASHVKMSGCLLPDYFHIAASARDAHSHGCSKRDCAFNASHKPIRVGTWLPGFLRRDSDVDLHQEAVVQATSRRYYIPRIAACPFVGGSRMEPDEPKAHKSGHENRAFCGGNESVGNRQCSKKLARVAHPQGTQATRTLKARASFVSGGRREELVVKSADRKLTLAQNHVIKCQLQRTTTRSVFQR
jgi:hypothetical protein